MTTLRTVGRAVAGAAVAGLAVIGAGLGPAAADQPVEANNQPKFHGSTYELQNYFNAFGALTPFFEPFEGRVGPKVEIPGNYIYDIDIQQRAITLSWNTDAEWDIFEPYVGAAGGFDQEAAASLPIFDEYWITFSKPVSDLVFSADPDQPLVPNIRIEGDDTVVISIPGGTTIGDGYDAVINITRG